MIRIFDTNILIGIIRRDDFAARCDEKYFKQSAKIVTSVVIEGELRSFALQHEWGKGKIDKMNQLLKKLVILPIKTRPIIEAYASIDAYSQGKLAGRPLPNGLTSRNMGKNDLWIAATAHAANATLVTTDQDFDHLNDTFLDLDWIDIQQFIK